MTDETPKEGEQLTPLAQAAAATNEIFREYVSAGFTREEALQLVIALQAYTLPRHPPKGD